ncbi:MAG: hypothetical protein ABIP97_04745 [Chthoniobacterales bacterium]
MFGKKKTFINPKLARSERDYPERKEIIHAYDKQGRKCFISREDWCEHILPVNLKKAWSNPQQLAALIIQSLTVGLYTDMLQPAERLRAIDLHTERSAAVLATVYMKLQRTTDAEEILHQEMHHHHETGGLIANLAKLGQETETRPALSRIE